MKNKKDMRMGEVRKNKQGLTMQIVKYVNNKNVGIVFIETGEQKTVRYVNFCNGNVRADIVKYPYIVVKKAKSLARVTKCVLAIMALLLAIGSLILIFK